MNIVLNNNLDITNYVTSLPEFIFSLEFQNNFITNNIEIQAIDNKKYIQTYITDYAKRMPIQISFLNNIIFSGYVENIFINEEKIITIVAKPNVDFNEEIQSSIGYSCTMYDLLRSILNDSEIEYDKATLKYVSNKLTDCSFLYTHSDGFSLLDLFSDITSKTGICIYYFSKLYFAFLEHKNVSAQKFFSRFNVRNINTINTTENITNNYEVQYYGSGTYTYTNDTSIFRYGKSEKQVIDAASSGLIFADEKTAKKCTQVKDNFYSYPYESYEIDYNSFINNEMLGEAVLYNSKCFLINELKYNVADRSTLITLS